MFCRRISSLFLLIIIVLSITRNPFIANSAEISPEIEEQKNQALFDETQNMIRFYQSLHNFMLRNNEKLQLQKNNEGLELLNKLKTTLSRKAASPQDLESALLNWLSVADQFEVSHFAVHYGANGQHVVWDNVTKTHFNLILYEMNELVKLINDSELATLAMTKLIEFPYWDGMASNHLEILLNMIELLSEHVTDSALFVEQLCRFLEKKENLTPDQINKILSLLEKSITPKNESKYTKETIYRFCCAIYGRLPSYSGDKINGPITLTQLTRMFTMLQILV